MGGVGCWWRVTACHRCLSLQRMSDEVTEDYFPGKWVRIMADYSGDPVWSRDGNSVLDILPISVGTRIRLDEWAYFYEFNDDYLDPHDRKADFPDELFTKWGWRLAKQVKKELPDWTVVYHQENNGMEFEVISDE